MRSHDAFTGVVHEGDELLEINGIPVVGKTTEQIGKLMVSFIMAPASHDIIVFPVIS